MFLASALGSEDVRSDFTQLGKQLNIHIKGG